MKKERLLIIIDVEGCVGVYEDTVNAVQLMQNELEYILQKFSLVYDITVVDLHSGGENIKIHEKYKQVDFVDRIWQIDFNIKYDKAILLGLHSKQASNGILSHTFRPEFLKMMVGEYVIGEIGILINWLSFYNIPVVFITGDSSIADEAEFFDVEYLAVKDKNDNRSNINFTVAYNKIAEKIDTNLRRDIQPIKYNNNKVYVILKNKDYLNYLPTKVFNMEKDMLVFDDTLCFTDSLFELAIFLNSVNHYYNLVFRKFKQYVRRNFTKDILDNIKDERFQHILKQTDVLALDIPDIDYCYRILRNI